MAWEARPEGALDRWCVVEESEQRVRIIADDLSEEEARRISASGDLLHGAAWLINCLDGDSDASWNQMEDADSALKAAVAKAKGRT